MLFVFALIDLFLVCFFFALVCLFFIQVAIAGQATAAGSSEEEDLQLKAIMSQLKSTKDDKEKLENDLSAAQQEKERLEEQVKNLEMERRQEAQTELRGDRPKLVAVAGVVQQQEQKKPAPRKQQQPQAHIQPHSLLNILLNVSP